MITRFLQALLVLTFGAVIYIMIWYKDTWQLDLHFPLTFGLLNDGMIDSVQSTCSPQAAARGPHQKVISYSFYGKPHHPRLYYEGLWVNADRLRWLYPGWVMRVYHDVERDTEFRRELEARAGLYPHLDLCYVGELPRYGNLTGTEQMTWRFLPMADPLVDVFLSRDADSMPLEREVAAVNEWLSSSLTIHVMRDHISHKEVILGGLWGARLQFRRENFRMIAEKLTSQPQRGFGHDQRLLATHLWPHIQGDVIQHDSYRCDNIKFLAHGHMSPFPSRRNESAPFNFVGNSLVFHRKPVLRICPEGCRPRNHRDWLYC